MLGERERGTARLQEAVTAYRMALEELTRERAPLPWATTQNNLGTALRKLGERESSTARLQEAVAAFDACLTVTSVQKVRSHRDETQAEITRRRVRETAVSAMPASAPTCRRSILSLSSYAAQAVRRFTARR